MNTTFKIEVSRDLHLPDHEEFGRACEIIEDCGKDVKSAREKLKELALATSLEKYEQ